MPSWVSRLRRVARGRRTLRAAAGRFHAGSIVGLGLGAMFVVMLLAGCGSTSASSASGGKVTVVAAENFWGSIAAQMGGTHVQVTSLISSPDTDPHDYELTSADARAFAVAQYAIVNGAGYDTWAQKALDASPNSARK